jgi:two-component system copper resistance phosphate regulon response regulator CusR
VEYHARVLHGPFRSITTVKVLIIDDDPSFRRLASLALEEARIEHAAVPTASEATRVLREEGPFDLILLDQELPGMKGAEFLAQIRAKGVMTPVVLVSVREGVDEKVRALELGADDYVVKPFVFDELVARLRAILRRMPKSELLRVGNVELEPLRRRAKKCGRPLALTTREFEVLLLLAQAGGRAISRKEFLHRIWEVDFDPESNSLQVHVSRLRQKLGANGGVRIETVRGQGYRLVAYQEVGTADHGAVSPEVTSY